MDTRINKSMPRVMEELNAELVNLRVACENWEFGHYEQTTNIAKALRVLLYDYGTSSQSLFGLVGWKSKPFFVTPSTNKHLRVLAEQKVIGVTTRGGSGVATSVSRWKPKYVFGGVQNRRDVDSRIAWDTALFDEWWSEPVLASHAFTASRRDLVLIVSNELGGTHAASRIKPITAALLGGDLDYGPVISFHSTGGVGMTQENAVYDAVVRQVAFEVQVTVAHHYAETAPKPAVVPALPDELSGMRRGSVQIKQDPHYLRSVLVDLEKIGEGNTVLAEDIRAKLYWDDRARDMRTRGLV